MCDLCTELGIKDFFDLVFTEFHVMQQKFQFFTFDLWSQVSWKTETNLKLALTTFWANFHSEKYKNGCPVSLNL